MKRFLLPFIIVLALVISSLVLVRETEAPTVDEVNEETLPVTEVENAPTTLIARAAERVTLKPFGIKISPANSPVKNEKFAGYHSGVDFETFPDEANIDVPIFALCTGELLVKRTASGYGGVVVQTCTINEEPVTVIYGHIRLSSVTSAVGTIVNQGNQIAVLGAGFSTETDGERKHLHLGIHRGENVAIAGYVSTEAELKNWIDVMTVLSP